MLMNLPFVSLSILDILEIDIATVISPFLCIKFAKIHTDREATLSMTLLFGSMLNLVKRFH